MLTFFLLSVFSEAFSQKIISQKGLKIAEFSLGTGKIQVYLPDDARSGDLISGTIKFSPFGQTEKQLERSLNDLQKREIRINNPSGETLTKTALNITNDEPTHYLVTSASPILLIEVYNNDKKEQSVPVSAEQKNNTASTNCSTPSHVLTGSPMPIQGNFDGNISTSNIRINNQAAEVLAESPRQCVINFPISAKGNQKLSITDNGNMQCEKNVSGVDMAVSAGKLSLIKGEKTFVDIKLTGLQNLPSAATLTVTNTTTSTVNMAGGNMQVITIPPSSVFNGEFQKKFDIQSIKTGNFSVDINLDLPDPKSSMVNSTSGWTVCDLGVITCILPASICDQLKKGMDEKLETGPGFSVTAPIPNPYSNAILNTSSTNGEIFFAISDQQSGINTGQVIFSVSEIIKNSEKDFQKEQMIGKDSTPADGLNLSFAEFRLDPGVYRVNANAYYGSNHSVLLYNYISVPSKKNPPSVRNTEINNLEKEEKRLRDSLNAINRRIQRRTDEINRNNRRREYLDSLQWVEGRMYYQLHRIDALLEQIPEPYGDKLKAILDSLESLRNRLGTMKESELPETVDDLQQNVDDLEKALEACKKHLADLKQEQEDLAAEKAQIQAAQQQAFKDIIDACHQAGYGVAGTSSRDKSSGQFGYSFGLVLRGPGGSAEFVKAIPAQALKTVSNLQNQIKAGNARIAEINARQASLPGEIADSQKECDELEAQLAKAKNALKNGKDNLAAYNHHTADLEAVCLQIKKLLEPLVNWCKSHPGECNSFQYRLNKILEDCPGNIKALPALMDDLKSIIAQKQQVENSHKKKADDLERQKNELDKKNNELQEELETDKNKAEDYGGALGKNMKDQDKAIADEIARRQRAQAEKDAARKRVCIEFLKSQAQSEEEASIIEHLASIKEQVEGMAQNVKTASDIADRLTKDQLKDLTDKLRNNIDKLLEQFEQIDALKEKLDELTELKDDLSTLLSDDPSAKAAADKMGVVLKRINNVLNEVSEKFPILQVFTAYFGFMVEAFNAIISGAYNAVTMQIKYYMEQALKGLTCEKLVNKYQQRNSLDDAYAEADRMCRNNDAFMLGIVNNREKERIYEEELKKYVLKIMMDCCLKYAIQ